MDNVLLVILQIVKVIILVLKKLKLNVHNVVMVIIYKMVINYVVKVKFQIVKYIKTLNNINVLHVKMDII